MSKINDYTTGNLLDYNYFLNRYNLIGSKIKLTHLQLNQIKDCVLSSAGVSVKFRIIDAKLHVPIVTLSTKNNVNLTKQE